jgi:hypothetical protein
MSQPNEFTVSVETVNELRRCRADQKVRLDVSSSTFPITTSDRESDADARVAAAERLLGAIALYVNEVMVNERDNAEKWVLVLHLTLDRTPQHLSSSPRTHLARFQDSLQQRITTRFGMKKSGSEDALNRLGTDLYQWIDAHRELLKDQYRLEKLAGDQVNVEAKGYGHPSAARILGEPRPREKRVEPLIPRGK